MTDTDLLERAVAAFHDEYRRIFPPGGDAQDHDEAIESAVGAVITVVGADRTWEADRAA